DQHLHDDKPNAAGSRIGGNLLALTDCGWESSCSSSATGTAIHCLMDRPLLGGTDSRRETTPLRGALHRPTYEVAVCAKVCVSAIAPGDGFRRVSFPERAHGIGARDASVAASRRAIGGYRRVPFISMQGMLLASHTNRSSHARFDRRADRQVPAG